MTGATNCCDFTDSESAEECLANPTIAAYWECVMAGKGFLLDNMPCYTGDVLSTVDSATTSTTDSSPGSAATDDVSLEAIAVAGSGAGVATVLPPRVLVLVEVVLCFAVGMLQQQRNIIFSGVYLSVVQCRAPTLRCSLYHRTVCLGLF